MRASATRGFDVDAPVALGAYLLDWHERRRTQLRPTTHKSYAQVIRCYLLPHLGNVPLPELNRPVIEQAYARLLASGGLRGRPLAAKTVRYCHTVLRRALEDARIDGLVATNAAEQARAPRLDPADDEADGDLQVWTGEQAARFLAFVDDHPWRALWHLALGTGARRGELLGLRWRDVDLDRGEVRIRRALTVVDGVARLLGTKTSRARTLSIGPTVVDALRRRQSEQRRHRDAGEWHDRWGLVFTEPNGTHLDPMRVTLAFRDLVRAAPVPVLRMHDLRHCHASLLIAGNVPIKVISERLGHTTIAMTMDVYGHLLPGMDASAAARFEELLWPPAGGA